MDYTYPATSAASVESSALGAGMMLVVFLFAIAVYIYAAYCLYTIGKKTNTPNEWMAWVPIVNVFYMLQIARLPLWWFLGILIPFLNLIVIIYVWVKIAEMQNRGVLWGVLMIISPVNLVLLWFLAFAEAPAVSSPSMPSAPTPPSAPLTPPTV